MALTVERPSPAPPIERPVTPADRVAAGVQGRHGRRFG